MPKLTAKPPQTNKQQGRSNLQSDLEPSRAWIKNLGAGTTKEMPKRRSKRDNTLVMCTTASQPSAAELSDKPNDADSPVDNTMVSIPQQIDDTTTTRQTNENGTHDINSSSMVFQTCLAFDTIVNKPNESKCIDNTPIGPKTLHTKSSGNKKTNRSKQFPLESTRISDEISLYEGKGTIDFMYARVGNKQNDLDELLAMKHETNEHFDDTFINVTSPHDFDRTLINREMDDVKQSRAHELSINLGSFDLPSTWSRSSLFGDSTLIEMPLSPALNSTELITTNTMAQIDKASRDLRRIGLEKCRLNIDMLLLRIFF